MIKKTFINGLKVFLPIAATFALVYWIFQSIEAFFGGFYKKLFGEAHYFDGLGFIIGVALVFAIGILINAWIIKQFYTIFESILEKIPFIKILYNSAKELIDFFDKEKNQPKQAVLVETNLGRVLGFVTCENLNLHSSTVFEDEEICVYIPLSYQIGGLMIITHLNKVQIIDMPINKAMSMVLTAGMVGKQKRPRV